MDFKIIAPGGNEIQLSSKNDTAVKPGLIFNESIIAKAEFGRMEFHNYIGDGFQIWYSNYCIDHATEMLGMADIVVLELHIQFQNNFMVDWDGVGKNEISTYQYNLTHTPFVNNWVKFNPGKEYFTFDIHFTKEYLARLAPGFKKLDKFLEKVEKAAPAQYAAVDHFLTPAMLQIVKQLLACSFTGTTAKFYIGSKVMELLILALEHSSGEYTQAPIKLSPYDIERLHEAKQILLADFENKITITQLSRKVCLNEFKLKNGFKYLFGSPIFTFHQEAKMQAAKIMLLETQLSMDDIAFKLGFDFASNFSITFKKQVGCNPAYFRKNKFYFHST